MKTKFIEISPFSNDFARMQQFARSFDHEICASRNSRVFAFERGEKTIGYADVIYVPIAFPAFHPEIVSPRGIVEVLHGWKSHCELSHGGDGIIGVPLDSDRQTFPKEMIENVGFTRAKREIYTLANRA